ncbi:MAG: SPOR domain-containing protein [Candidatus Omnitrophota bacterium]
METGSQQLELFSGTGRGPETASSGGRGKFFGHIRGHEKVILIAIGVIIVAVAAFSLGVEKGRRTAMPEAPVSRKPTQAAIPQQRLAPAQIPVRTVAVSAPAQQNYTIQLASFQNKNLAKKEAEALKKQGLAPMIITKGSYNILCVGSFTSKETAKPLLSEIKKKYRDSFIRRL